MFLFNIQLFINRVVHVYRKMETTGTVPDDMTAAQWRFQMRGGFSSGMVSGEGGVKCTLTSNKHMKKF